MIIFNNNYIYILQSYRKTKNKVDLYILIRQLPNIFFLIITIFIFYNNNYIYILIRQLPNIFFNNNYNDYF